MSRPVVESDAEPGSLDVRGREHYACFSSMPRSDNRLLGGLPMHKFPGLPTCRIPWSQGKKQGISRNSAALCEYPSRKHVRFSICEIIPYAIEQGIFSARAGNQFRILDRSREFRAKTDPRDPTHIRRYVCRSRETCHSRARGSRSPQPCRASRLHAALRLTSSPHRGPTAGYPLPRVGHVLS